MKKLAVVTHVVFIPETKGLDQKEDGRPIFVLEEPFHFWVNGTHHFKIPSGFRFDYASVPRGLWNLFPPYDPEYAAAALIHDWCYAGEFFPRDFCDELFLGAMKFRGVPDWKRNTMYAAVRLFGGKAYKTHKQMTKETVRRMSGFSGEKSPLWKRLS